MQARYAGNGVYAGSVGTDASVVVNANPVSLSSNRLVFGNQTMNSASAAQTVTLNNGSSSNITFSAITMGGGNPGQFSLAAGTSCKAGLALPAGGSCTLSMQFTPTLNQNVGDKMAYLMLTHSAGSPLITLTGTTTMPAQTTASVNPTSQLLSTPPQTPSVEGIFILSNTGSSPLMFYAGAASLQGVNASLFTLLPSSSCLSSAGVNVPVGQSCTLAVQFKPTAAVIPNTIYPATLILNLNTPSPLKIPLSGKVNNSPQVYYIHPDHLNTPRMITNQAGTVVWRWDNTDPFGNNISNQNPSGLGTFEYNPRFPGQYFDKETNLNYNGFRDYDPAIGRYIESDPIGLMGGINTFGYVGGNPLRYNDPKGLDRWGDDPSMKRIPATNDRVQDLLCQYGDKVDSPTSALMNARDKGYDRYDDSLAAAERFSEMMDGDWAGYPPFRQSDFNFGQFVLKSIRNMVNNGKGNGSKDAGFVAKWGAIGAFNYDQKISWQMWKQKSCGCQK